MATDSLYLQSLGTVEVRGITPEEMALLWRSAQRTTRGNIKATKWLLLVGSLVLGVTSPRMNKKRAESFIKKNAKDAARLAEAIISLTTREP